MEVHLDSNLEGFGKKVGSNAAASCQSFFGSSPLWLFLFVSLSSSSSYSSTVTNCVANLEINMGPESLNAQGNIPTWLK